MYVSFGLGWHWTSGTISHLINFFKEPEICSAAGLPQFHFTTFCCCRPIIIIEYNIEMVTEKAYKLPEFGVELDMSSYLCKLFHWIVSSVAIMQLYVWF